VEDNAMMPTRLAAVMLLCGMLNASFADAQAQAVKKISDGQVSKTAPNWPAFIAVDKGFFRREGIELETVYVGNVANTVQQLVAGSFDVASSTFDTAVRAIGNGGNAVMIGGVVTKYPYSIMTVPEVRSAADMKGKRIILPFPKDLLTIVWNRWLTEQGMRPDDVEQTYTGATPNRLAALVSGAVHAALLTQPFDFRAEAQGYRKLIDIGAFGKEYGFLTVLARPQWLRDNPDTARGYLRAMTAAVDWLYDPANRNEAIEILARETKLDPSIAAQTYNHYVGELQPFSRKLAIPDEIIRSTVKTLIELGDIKPEAASARYVDGSYLPR
jgi:NitT/TauT family transport system substrate-binding protein